MGQGLIELAAALMTSSERRLDLSARNISNVSTPGYKRLYPFEPAIGAGTEMSASPEAPASQIASDRSQGGLNQTGRALDLAIVGDGLFQLRSEHGVYYTRNGQFERGADGRLVNAQGFVLQTASGEDVVVGAGPFNVSENGDIVENGMTRARIGVFAPQDWNALTSLGGSLFQADPAQIQDVDGALIRQGSLETANTQLAQEMLDMMQTLRSAEAGARLAQTYDSLMGQSITTLGRTQ